MCNHFQGKTDGYIAYGGTQWYRGSVESFSILMKGYSSDLSETKLKSLSYNKLNGSIKDIHYFYSYWKYYQNHFAISQIQITADRKILTSPRLDLCPKIDHYFANSIKSKNNNKSGGIKKINNINPILVHCYIWNCIHYTMHKRKDLKCGFDCKIRFESNILGKDNKYLCIKYLQEYTIDQLTQTNVFDNFLLYVKHKKHKKSINKCEEYLFDNDLTQLKELLEYLVSDLVSTSGDIDDSKKLFSEDNNCDSGFSNILGNRFCYGAFYNLTMYSLNLKIEMMFPEDKIYKFIFNLIIYLQCYPFCKHGPGMMDQEYYVREYFNCKDNTFPHIAQMKEFNCLDYSYTDGSAHGTLLLGAIDAVFRQICPVLIGNHRIDVEPSYEVEFLRMNDDNDDNDNNDDSDDDDAYSRNNDKRRNRNSNINSKKKYGKNKKRNSYSSKNNGINRCIKNRNKNIMIKNTRENNSIKQQAFFDSRFDENDETNDYQYGNINTTNNNISAISERESLISFARDDSSVKSKSSNRSGKSSIDYSQQTGAPLLVRANSSALNGGISYENKLTRSQSLQFGKFLAFEDDMRRGDTTTDDD